MPRSRTAWPCRRCENLWGFPPAPCHGKTNTGDRQSSQSSCTSDTDERLCNRAAPNFCRKLRSSAPVVGRILSGAVRAEHSHARYSSDSCSALTSMGMRWIWYPTNLWLTLKQLAIARSDTPNRCKSCQSKMVARISLSRRIGNSLRGDSMGIISSLTQLIARCSLPQRITSIMRNKSRHRRFSPTLSL